MTAQIKKTPLVFILSATLALGACGAHNSTGLRGGASMRVEVEVYKGPLSESMMVQRERLRDLGLDVAFETKRMIDRYQFRLDQTIKEIDEKIGHSESPKKESLKRLEDLKKHCERQKDRTTITIIPSLRTDNFQSRQDQDDQEDQDPKPPAPAASTQTYFLNERLATQVENDKFDKKSFNKDSNNISKPSEFDSTYFACRKYADLIEDSTLIYILAFAALDKEVGTTDTYLNSDLQELLDYALRDSKDNNSSSGQSKENNSSSGQPKENNSSSGQTDSLTHTVQLLKDLDRVDYGPWAILGARLRAVSGRWANQTFLQYVDSRIFPHITHFVLTTAEFGNQITARTDAIVWQLSKRIREDKIPPAAAEKANLPGVDVAKRLALSLYLRDSQPTGTLNVYEWTRNIWEDAFEDGIDLKATERVRLLETLVRDSYWSNVNTVHASGQGDVRMALIKDDIGNWNLKSFSNRPGQLLAAYRSAADAAISAAAEAASGGSAGQASKMLDLANRFSTGTSSAPSAAGVVDVDSIHKDASKDLADAKADYITKNQDLRASLTAAEKARTDNQECHKDRQTEIDKEKEKGDEKDESKIETLEEERDKCKENEKYAEGQVSEIRVQLHNLNQGAVVEIGEILTRHEGAVQVMQKSIMKSQTK